MDYASQDWLAKSNEIIFPTQAFINGESVSAHSGETFACYSPRDGRELTNVASCDKNDVDVAVIAARRVFESGEWSQASPRDRKLTLLRFADVVEKNINELALLESLDMGKPIYYSYHHDILGAIEKIRWVAECIDKIYGEIAPTPLNDLALMTREPVGVVGCVTPWNFPFYIACAKALPALAMGNSVILKPAEQSPLTTLKMAELAHEAGLPQGVFNVIPGFGETAGQAIGLHPDIDVVTFTGSTEVGRHFLRYSADSNMKKILLECGGKSPCLVFADCKDLDEAAEVAAGVFYNQGEVCCARTRLLVQNSIKDKLVKKIIALSDQYQPTDPLVADATMGAMVDQAQMQQVLKYIQKGQAEGADLVLGGKQVRKDSAGYYIEPTIFTAVHNDMVIAREEIFGPVLSVIGFDTDEQAIDMANDTEYGLAASVWTQDIYRVFKVSRALKSGVVSINSDTTSHETTAFGGYKMSGIGREGSLHDFENYVEIKTTWISL